MCFFFVFVFFNLYLESMGVYKSEFEDINNLVFKQYIVQWHKYL